MPTPKPLNAQPPAQSRQMVLFLLTLVYGFNFIDRQILGILAPYVQADLDLSNTQLGLLVGFAFAMFYAIMGIPIAMIADRVNRVTLLSIALAVWSGFTAMTGAAQNFAQIAFARIGVGIGEAGGSPASHSIISDLYSKEERAGALGIYSLGIPLGIMSAYFITAALIGSAPTEVNWRRIFYILGGSGIIFALIVRLFVREPERGQLEAAPIDENSSIDFKGALGILLRIPSWWYMCLGIASASFAAYALGGFQTKFLRQLEPTYDFRTMVIWLGIINGTTYCAGTYFGAKLVDLWAKRDIRAYGWLPALAALTALPLLLASFWINSVNIHLALIAGVLLCIGTYLGPSFAIAQTLAPVRIRATSTALFFLILNLIALGGGPSLAGILIDHFTSSHDELMATRLGMTWVSLSFLLAIFFFYKVTRSLPKDWERAEKHANS